MTKKEIVKNYIINKIKSKELSIGDKLPTEPVLCKECNVSTITVRNALNDLLKENIILKVQGSGSYIKDTSKWTKKQYILICLDNKHLKYSITQIYPKISIMLKEKTEEMGYTPFIYYINEENSVLENLNINPKDILCVIAISSKDVFKDLIKYEIPILNVLFGENENHMSVNMDLLDLYSKINEYIIKNKYKNPLIIGLEPDGDDYVSHWVFIKGINTLTKNKYKFIGGKEYIDIYEKTEIIDNYFSHTNEKHDLLVFVDASLYNACEILFNKYDNIFKNTQFLTHKNSIIPLATRYKTDFIEFDVEQLVFKTTEIIKCIINKKYMPYVHTKIKCSIKYENP